LLAAIASNLIDGDDQVGIIIASRIFRVWEPLANGNEPANIGMVRVKLQSTRVGLIYFISSTGHVKTVDIDPAKGGRLFVILTPSRAADLSMESITAYIGSSRFKSDEDLPEYINDSSDTADTLT
jgi:hypothetical protein